jgi:hypothetical protein
VSEPPPDKKDPGTGSTDRTDNTPSVRSVAVGAVSLTVAALAVVGFAVAGPLGLVAAGAVTAGGGAAAARARLNRNRTGTGRQGRRQGVLAALLTRPRRTRTVTTTTKTWPLTGSQSKRARKATGAAGGSTGGRRRGAKGALSGLSAKIPALTRKGRANRAAAHLGAHGRPVAKRPAGAAAPRPGARFGRASTTGRPGAKAPGIRAPHTPTRTPARAGSARKLTTAPRGRTRAATAGGAGRGAGRGAAGRSGVATTRKPSTRRNGTHGGVPRRTGRHGLSTSTGKNARTGVRPSTNSRPVRRHSINGKTPRVTTPSRPGRKPTPTRPSTSTPTRPKTRRHGSAATRKTATFPRTSGKRQTTRARRIGTTPTRRIDHRRPGPKVPNRHPHARQPYKPTPTKKLVKTAMRLPRRNGWHFTRPTKAQTRKARRHLSRRARAASWRGVKFTAKAPFLLARSSYRHRPLWLWPTPPGPVREEWLVPTEPAKMRPQRDPRPKKPDTVPVPPSDPPTIKTRKHRRPYPKTHARRAPAGAQPATATTGGTATMTAPAESMSDAFAAIANFTPQTPEEMEQFLLNCAEMVQQFGAAFQTLGSRMTSEYPIEQPVAAGVQELGAALGACQAIAGEVHSTYLAAHETERQRRENPRNNEGFWDVNNR